MPELPEVETYVRELAPQLRGRSVVQAQVFWPRTIAAPAAADFARRLVGRCFTTFERRGKYMLLGLEGGDTLIVHLRMTGKLVFAPAEQAPDKHTHVVLDLDSIDPAHARLFYIDSRKFGRMWLTDDPASVLAKLGPEPFSPAFTPNALAATLHTRKACIKALLLDQRVVAGVGNIYADEALFRAGIHPARPGGTLTEPEIARLHAAVCAVLQQGIDRQGSSLGGSSLQNYVRPSGVQGDYQAEHQVFRRTGQPCFVCDTHVERIVLAQRSTHFCPTCQPI